MNGLSTLSYKNESNVFSFEIPTPFPVGPVNLYLLLGEKITLVDTGPKTELAWKSLIYQLNKNGFRLKDIDQVFITHHHVDHSGLAAVLSQHHPEIKVIAHQASVPWIEKRSESVKQMVAYFKQLYYENGLSLESIDVIRKYHQYFDQYIDPIKVTEIIEDETSLVGNNDWVIIHSPGHSQGHISLYNQNTKILIAGDHIIEHTSSGTFMEPPINKNEERPLSMVEYKNSLERIRKMDIREVLSGHGRVITNPNELIDLKLNKFIEKKEKVKKVLMNNELSVFELMKIIYSERYKKNIILFFSEILGTLDILEVEGEINHYYKDGIIKYYLKN